MNHEFHTKTFVTDPEYPEPGSEIGPDSPSSGDDTKIITEPSPKKRFFFFSFFFFLNILGSLFFFFFFFSYVYTVKEEYRREWFLCRSVTWKDLKAKRKHIHRRIRGLGGNMAKSPSKGLLIPGMQNLFVSISFNPLPLWGYYRCSSSKGCPARKQVERSRVDPTTLVITYAGEHNHPVPTKLHHSSYAAAAGVGAGAVAVAMSPTDEVPAKFAPEEELAVFASQPELELSDDSAALLDQHGQHHRHHWFDDVASTALLESPICAGSSACMDAYVAVLFGEKDDEESLFADLGELPECSVVFRRRIVEPEEQNRSCSLSAVPCCGSTG
ncbi:hypothetical protein FEM48_Zijuj04G0107200 [Ziziphus jujuba var. spinosa]|uniref:WRKY domain-containing protein n=1 Tax=Ziziphus jujuba var. spinosa TaxID=714518 RepID=A0A978VJF4_ZIZJJ|nr:hypothetical protein FEM48_Zijuj04G0107200 [Ziziphus jujuba var. spinosa]